MKKFLFPAFMTFLMFSHSLWAAPPKVAVSISPIHALVTAMMLKVGEPILLVDPGASPHNYALKPSQVLALNSADLVIWVGESLETFLIKPIKQLPKHAHTITLLKIPGISPLPFRSNLFGEEDHNHHHHKGLDPHIWLDPERMQTIIPIILIHLIKLDPENKTQYERNSAEVLEQLMQLDQQIAQALLPVKNKPFIVFHDAYQYFEKRYQLNAVGAVTLNPEMMPSAQHIKAIQDLIKQHQVQCIFSEPQFKPAIVESIAKDTGVRVGELNPEGSFGKGYSSYAHLLIGMSDALKECLTSG